MFKTSARVEYDLFLRQKDINIDENILKLFINYNKVLMKHSFFNYNMACSWATTQMPNFYEVLFVISPVNNVFPKSRIPDIYRENIHRIIKPEYHIYQDFINKFTDKSDLLTNVRRIITNERIMIYSEAAYMLQMSYILEELDWSFFHISTFEDSIPSAISTKPVDDISMNINHGTLCFIGCYFHTLEMNSLRKVLAYKLLEKLFGINESTSIYYPLRQRGLIYTGISTYFMNKSRFLTGVMGTYSDEFYNEVMTLIASFSITRDKFNYAKESLLNELKYTSFQYGELFTLFPYYCKTKRKVTLNEILSLLQILSMEEVYKHIPQAKGSIRVGEP